jgi:hypothetical protein
MQKLSIDTQKEYLNKPQLMAMLVDANEQYHVWGRGTGKTRGVLAPKVRRDVYEMPRCLILNVGETYQQILTRTLPSLIEGLESLGIYKDYHYVIGKRPDKKLGYKEPYQPPQSFDNTIVWNNGSCMSFISQDKKGSSNGLNADVHVGDEVKYLKHEQYLEETFPTLRANKRRWGHLHFHCSICFTTSMPTLADSKWIFQKGKEMDPKRIEMILYEQIHLNKLKLEYEKITVNGIEKVSALDNIRLYENRLTKLRKDCVHISYADTFENVAILGEDYIRKMRRTMPDFIFNTEIRNIKPEAIEGGFYNGLTIETHTYSSYDNAYLESRGFDIHHDKLTCRQDSDIDRSLPLRIGVDWGDSINCMSIAQYKPDLKVRFKWEINFLKNIFVKSPLMLDDLADEFIDYYAPLPWKEVYMNADPQGRKGQANSYETWNTQFCKKLRNAGWIVHDVSRGKYPSHMYKYLLWNQLINSNGSELPKVRFNRHNCKELLISMMQAPSEQKSGRVGKDKLSEKNKEIPQEEATHLSDSADLIVCDLLEDVMHNRPEFMDMMA